MIQPWYNPLWLTGLKTPTKNTKHVLIVRTGACKDNVSVTTNGITQTFNTIIPICSCVHLSKVQEKTITCQFCSIYWNWSSGKRPNTTSLFFSNHNPNDIHNFRTQTQKNNNTCFRTYLFIFHRHTTQEFAFIVCSDEQS